MDSCGEDARSPIVLLGSFDTEAVAAELSRHAVSV